MKVRKLGFVSVMALVLSLLASGPVSANEQDWGGRAPNAESSAKKKKAKVKEKAEAKAKTTKKAKGKVTTKAKAKTKTKAKGAKKVARARRATAPKSHYPTQPHAGAAEHPAGLPELSNEQKDDLPPPQNTEPQEE